ncbi:hypothetical protein GCM10023082_50150 [Streptomyces tremellae]|uniref:Uncharacterized protein n=1 Tax=Streptomyces tremellae TaxID=1124239 RepID=A0ABP7FTA1_9ACTN
MRTPIPHTDPPLEGRGLQMADYGLPSQALLARAEQGYARFLSRHITEQGTVSEAGECHCQPCRPPN